MGNAMIKYSKDIKRNSWCRWMVGRTMRKNLNNLVSVVGKTGSGKTWSAISICETMSKLDGVPFTIDHIVFTLTELMDLINSGKLKKGSKIIFDEPQVTISAREFQSEANKVFNYLISTFRHRNLTLFFCTPFETLLDKNTRRLFHARFQTMSINPNKKVCRLYPRYTEYVDFKEQPYNKQMIVFYKDKDGRDKNIQLKHWDVEKPSNEMIKQYEQKKLDFTDNLNRNITERLKKFDESGNSITAQPRFINRKELTRLQKIVMKVLSNGDTKEAMKFIGVTSSNTIDGHKKGAYVKGYTLEEFKGDKWPHDCIPPKDVVF